jgi:hypothetical protein
MSIARNTLSMARNTGGVSPPRMRPREDDFRRSEVHETRERLTGAQSVFFEPESATRKSPRRSVFRVQRSVFVFRPRHGGTEHGTMNTEHGTTGGTIRPTKDGHAPVLTRKRLPGLPWRLQ